MVGRRRKQRATRLAGNHQRCWLWGRNAVVQALAGRWTPVALLAADRLDSSLRQQIEQSAAQLQIPLEWSSFEALTARCGSTEHQGLMAMMPEFPYEPLDETIIPRGRPAFVLLLEGIQDPHNFGAILRSAEVFGVDAVIVGETGQSEITPHVARASAGAVNHLKIARVSEVLDAATWLQEHGLRIVGATGRGDLEIADCDLKPATALVIGNEGSGISEELLARCDQLVCIPQTGQTESLNAAVAAGILCYETGRQRRSTGG